MTSQSLTMDCFTQSKPCICAHVYSLRYNKVNYLQQLHRILRNPTAWSNVSHAIKCRCFASLHICSEHKEVDNLLPHLEVTDIEKGLNFLDRTREARQLENKIEKLERDNPQLIQVETDAPEGEDCEDAGRGTHATEGKGHQKSRRKIDKLRRALKELQTALEFGEAGGCRHENDTCAKAHQDSAVTELIQSGSVSGSLSRKIRKWAKSQRPDFLEYVMLEFSTKSWQNVADLVHFNPKNDFAVPYFLDDVYGRPIPEDSFVYCMRQLLNVSTEDIVSVFCHTAQKFPQIYDAYAYLRTKPALMANKEIVEDLVRNIPLHLALWNFEELYRTSKGCSKILQERLGRHGDLSNTIDTSTSKVYTYGKLVERILTFQKMGCNELANSMSELAQHRLEHLKEMYNVPGKTIAVFGDASSSMQTAIEAATILAAMLSACLNAELSFFGSGLIKSPHKKPSTVEQTLEVCKKIQANGCTSLAAALWPYYEEKKHLDMIVLVTDEEENTDCNGYYFAGLEKLYTETVNPGLEVSEVCVGPGDYRYRLSLKANGIQCKTVTIDGSRPDLTKFDASLEQIAAFLSSSSSSTVSDAMGEQRDSRETNTTFRDADEDFIMIEGGDPSDW